MMTADHVTVTTSLGDGEKTTGQQHDGQYMCFVADIGKVTARKQTILPPTILSTAT